MTATETKSKPLRATDMANLVTPRYQFASRIVGEQYPPAVPYAAGVVFVAAAAGLNALAIDTLGQSSPFLLYYPAVSAAGLFCGLGPGLLASVLAALAILCLNVEPAFALKAPAFADGVRLAVFLLFSVMICVLSHMLRLTMRTLHRRDSLYRLMVSELKDYAVFMLDPGGFIMTWNAGAERIKGYKADEIVGRHFATFYAPEEAGTKPARELREAASQGRIEDEGWRVRKDGSRFWANVVVTAIHGEDGRLIGFSKITRDLSERRRAEEDLRDHAKRLEAAVADLEAFSHTVAHNLRAPLRTMQGYSSMLVQKAGHCLDAESRQLLDRISAASVGMDAMIQDLLAYERIKREEPSLGRVDLDALLPGLIERQDGTGADIRVVGPLGAVLGRETLLSQALANLLDNAVKFVPAGTTPRVAVRAERAAGRVRIVVQDNGPGIDPAYHEKLFKPFVRLDPSAEGTGIGLAIVKTSVERMHGTVGLESERGRGCRFWIDLPEAP